MFPWILIQGNISTIFVEMFPWILIQGNKFTNAGKIGKDSLQKLQIWQFVGRTSCAKQTEES